MSDSENGTFIENRNKIKKFWEENSMFSNYKKRLRNKKKDEVFVDFIIILCFLINLIWWSLYNLNNNLVITDDEPLVVSFSDIEIYKQSKLIEQEELGKKIELLKREEASLINIMEQKKCSKGFMISNMDGELLKIQSDSAEVYDEEIRKSIVKQTKNENYFNNKDLFFKCTDYICEITSDDAVFLELKELENGLDAINKIFNDFKDTEGFVFEKFVSDLVKGNLDLKILVTKFLRGTLKPELSALIKKKIYDGNIDLFLVSESIIQNDIKAVEEPKRNKRDVDSCTHKFISYERYGEVIHFVPDDNCSAKTPEEIEYLEKELIILNNCSDMLDRTKNDITFLDFMNNPNLDIEMYNCLTSKLDSLYNYEIKFGHHDKQNHFLHSKGNGMDHDNIKIKVKKAQDKHRIRVGRSVKSSKVEEIKKKKMESEYKEWERRFSEKHYLGFFAPEELDERKFARKICYISKKPDLYYVHPQRKFFFEALFYAAECVSKGAATVYGTDVYCNAPSSSLYTHENLVHPYAREQVFMNFVERALGVVFNMDCKDATLEDEIYSFIFNKLAIPGGFTTGVEIGNIQVLPSFTYDSTVDFFALRSASDLIHNVCLKDININPFKTNDEATKMYKIIYTFIVEYIPQIMPRATSVYIIEINKCAAKLFKILDKVYKLKITELKGLLGLEIVENMAKVGDSTVRAFLNPGQMDVMSNAAAVATSVFKLTMFELTYNALVGDAKAVPAFTTREFITKDGKKMIECDATELVKVYNGTYKTATQEQRRIAGGLLYNQFLINKGVKEGRDQVVTDETSILNAACEVLGNCEQYEFMKLSSDEYDDDDDDEKEQEKEQEKENVKTRSRREINTRIKRAPVPPKPTRPLKPADRAPHQFGLTRRSNNVLIQQSGFSLDEMYRLANTAERELLSVFERSLTMVEEPLVNLDFDNKVIFNMRKQIHNAVKDVGIQQKLISALIENKGNEKKFSDKALHDAIQETVREFKREERVSSILTTRSSEFPNFGSILYEELGENNALQLLKKNKRIEAEHKKARKDILKMTSMTKEELDSESIVVSSSKTESDIVKNYRLREIQRMKEDLLRSERDREKLRGKNIQKEFDPSKFRIAETEDDIIYADLKNFKKDNKPKVIRKRDTTYDTDYDDDDDDEPDHIDVTPFYQKGPPKVASKSSKLTKLIGRGRDDDDDDDDDEPDHIDVRPLYERGPPKPPVPPRGKRLPLKTRDYDDDDDDIGESVYANPLKQLRRTNAFRAGGRGPPVKPRKNSGSLDKIQTRGVETSQSLMEEVTRRELIFDDKDIHGTFGGFKKRFQEGANKLMKKKDHIPLAVREKRPVVPPRGGPVVPPRGGPAVPPKAPPKVPPRAPVVPPKPKKN